MSTYFGLDGIRGIVNQTMTYDLAFRVGNALAQYYPKCKVIVGYDTRISRSLILLGFSSGLISGGGNCVVVGLCSTPCLSYLTRTNNCNFGVMITSSHNPFDYNGLKIFDSTGRKISNDMECTLEKLFMFTKLESIYNLGNIEYDNKLTKKYTNYLIHCAGLLNGLKIVLDCSNGATIKIAPYVFKKLGANVIKISCHNDGKNINNNCGSLYPSNLQATVLKTNADLGFAFDGDADRIIAVDNLGHIVDGDMIMYILAKNLKIQNHLNKNCVVGTTHTNKAIETALDNLGIKLLRSQIGDKYVNEKIMELGLNLGGEQSGHISLPDYHTTGDGVLTALILSNIVHHTHTPLSKQFDVKLLPQINIDIQVPDKLYVLNSPELIAIKRKIDGMIKTQGRYIIRASSTEPTIRIMVEHENNTTAHKIAELLKQEILLICKNTN